MIQRLPGAAEVDQRPAVRACAPAADAPLRQDLVLDAQGFDHLAGPLFGRSGLLDRAAPPDGGHTITLLDPTGLAAAALLQLLARAGGQPVRQLQLREPGGLRPVLLVSRSTLPRPGQPPLQVISPQVCMPATPVGHRGQDMACALAERADLAVVLLGHLPGPAITVLRDRLLGATRRPDWRCPGLLFVLPGPRPWAEPTLVQQPWPDRLQVGCLTELPGQPLALWNSIVARWQAWRAPDAAPRPGPLPTAPLAPVGGRLPKTHQAPHRAANQAVMARTDPPPRSPPEATAGADRPQAPAAAAARVLQPALAARCTTLLDLLQRLDGLQACAIVDLNSAGLLLTSPATAGPSVMARARARAATETETAHAVASLAALARALCDARRAQHLLDPPPSAAPRCPPDPAAGTANGPGDPGPDEVLLTRGDRQAMLRHLPGGAALGFLALADRRRVNLALLRCALLELEHLLATAP